MSRFGGNGVAAWTRTMHTSGTPIELDDESAIAPRAVGTILPNSSGEFMKISNSLIAIAVVAVMPLAAIAGDKDKMSTPQATSAQFEKLDTNRDGRISQSEASSDSKIVFSSADKNGDGFLDSSEYAHRGMTNDSMPNSDPATDSTTPRTDATAPDSTTPRQ
jgi:hypothetical protein